MYYNSKLLFSLFITEKIRKYINIYKNILKNILKNMKIYKIINFIKVYNNIPFIKLLSFNYKIKRSAYRAINILISYFYYRYIRI